jgi:hypothetical protein
MLHNFLFFGICYIQMIKNPSQLPICPNILCSCHEHLSSKPQMWEDVKKSIMLHDKGIEGGVAHMVPRPVLFQCIMLVMA